MQEFAGKTWSKNVKDIVCVGTGFCLAADFVMAAADLTLLILASNLRVDDFLAFISVNLNRLF